MYKTLFGITEKVIMEQDESPIKRGRILHHNDADGMSSGAVIYNSADINRSPDFKLIKVDYDDLPDLSDVKNDETIIIVDFSLPVEELKQLLEKAKNVIWIDHHKTAIDDFNAANIKSDKLEVVLDTKHSGVGLAWERFFQGKPTPRFVELIQDFDIWTWKFGDETASFQAGLEFFDMNPDSDLWVKLLDTEHDEEITNDIMVKGKVAVEWRTRFCQGYVDSRGFERQFEGLRAICVGLSGLGSFAFGNKLKDYDIGVTFEYDDNGWHYGLYSTKSEVVCGKIAQSLADKHGGTGGGHPGAAGLDIKKFLLGDKNEAEP